MYAIPVSLEQITLYSLGLFSKISIAPNTCPSFKIAISISVYLLAESNILKLDLLEYNFFKDNYLLLQIIFFNIFESSYFK